MLKLIRMAGLVLVAICHLFPGNAFAESIVGPTRAVPGAYFGMHCFYCGASLRWPGEVDTTLPMGVGSWRLWDALGSTWLSVEPAKGTWDFSYLDHYVAKGQSRGTELVLTLGQTPTWASARPLEIGGGGAGAAAEPANIQDWQDYVAKVATRYKGKIAYYEIWNEPALLDIEQTVGISGKAGFYSGTAGKLAELERVAAETIHSIDPLAKIITPSFSGQNQGMKRLAAYLSAGGGRYADVIGFHFYQVSRISPEDLPSFVRQVRDVTKRFGMEAKPIWNTESGLIIQPVNCAAVQPLEPNGTGSLSIVWPEDDAAGLVSRSLILGAASGLERFHWFAWDSGSMGLATSMGAKKARAINSAGKGFLRTKEWLEGARIVQCDVNAGQVSVCELERLGKTRWLAWSAMGSMNWTFNRSSEVARYVTLDGKSQAWPGPIVVGGKPVLLIGR